MYKIKYYIRRIIKFFYYGYHGSKCFDFDASSGIYRLTAAHMKRVSKFMHSNKTHLVWNDDPNTKGMRRLREFTELSEGMANNDLQSFHFYGIFKEKYPDTNGIDVFRMDRDSKIRRDMSRAFKKDRLVAKCKQERYEYLHKKYMPGFWD